MLTQHVTTAPSIYGWTCPKCGRVWAPITPGCFHCNAPAYQIGQQPSTGSPPPFGVTTGGQAIKEPNQ